MPSWSASCAMPSQPADALHHHSQHHVLRHHGQHHVLCLTPSLSHLLPQGTPYTSWVHLSAWHIIPSLMASTFSVWYPLYSASPHRDTSYISSMVPLNSVPSLFLSISLSISLSHCNHVVHLQLPPEYIVSQLNPTYTLCAGGSLGS